MKTIAVCLFLSIVAVALRQEPLTQSQKACFQSTKIDKQLLWEPIAQNASSACQTCRDNCSAAHVSCNNQACTANGGQNNGQQVCTGVKNQQGYINALKACEDQEKACWNQCPCK